MKLLIIGAGPGGYTAAFRAAALDMDVVLVEKDAVGGACLNEGCIPTKTLWKAADLAGAQNAGADYGVNYHLPTIDAEVLYAKKDAVVDQMQAGILHLAKSHANLQLVYGPAAFTGPKTVQVETEEGVRTFEPDAVIIATGAATALIPIPGLDSDRVIDSEALLDLGRLPESLVVIGGGVIGVEFAAILNRLGVQVSLLTDYLLPNSDAECAKRLSAFMKKDGINMQVGYAATEVVETETGVKVLAKHLKRDKTLELEGELCLMATGRRAFYDGLGLEVAGIEFARDGILVNEAFQTSVPGVYAIGDVVSGNAQLAHVASNQALDLVERLAGGQSGINLDVVPACIFAFPELANVGATEEELKAQGVAYQKSKIMFASNGKAVSMGQAEGFVKYLYTDEGKLLGCHILGPHASDLIHEAALVMARGGDLADLATTIHAHPTLSEIVMDGAQGLLGTSVNLPGKRK